MTYNEKDQHYKRFTVTSALPYANGPVHIGHLAGVYVPADVYVRYLRAQGEDVMFIGGSDEHGVPITIKARKEGVTPQDIVDRYHKIIKDSFAELGISFDIYSRTSSPEHHETAAAYFKTQSFSRQATWCSVMPFSSIQRRVSLVLRWECCGAGSQTQVGVGQRHALKETVL